MEKDLTQVTGIQMLKPEEEQKVKEIMENLNLENNVSILQFGMEAQKNISNFADHILSEVRAKDADNVGKIISSLMQKIKEIDIEVISPKRKGIFAKILLLASLEDEQEKFIEKYQKLSIEIDYILEKLENAKNHLMRDNIMFDHLYEKNVEYFQQLELYIKAGKLKMNEFKKDILPQVKAKGGLSNDAFDAQQYNDLYQLVNQFEKKIHDLELSRAIALQTAMQIRLIQNSNQVLVKKIQSSIMNTIPLWKSQIIMAISLYRQGKALEMQKQVTDTTHELLPKNSERLNQNTADVTKESKRGIVEKLDDAMDRRSIENDDSY